MRELVLLLDEVKLWADGRVPPEPSSPDREEALDQEPDAPVHIAVDEDAPESVEHGVDLSGARLVEGGAALCDNHNGHLHAVVRRISEQHLDELQREQLVRHALVHEVGDEPRRGGQLVLVAGDVGAPKAHHEADEEQPADGRDLGVDDGRDGCQHVGEGRACGLGLEERTAEKAAPADEVLGEELRQDVADVGGRGLVH